MRPATCAGNALEAEREDRLPVLVVGLADGLGYLSD
jgi:hypothetical protein